MTRTAAAPRPATSRTRALAAAVTVLALLAAPVLTAVPARADTTGAITELALSVTDDGTASVGDIDPAADNGLVATNDAITMSWQVEATDLVDGVLTQTLPEGWSWVTSSLGKLSSQSSLYGSAYTVSGDGRTLTATMSIPGSSLISVSGLQAVPAITVAPGSVYTPELVATDASGSRRTTAADLTVVSVPQVTLGTSYLSRDDATHDFGSGPEQAVFLKAMLAYRAAANLTGQQDPFELDLPHRVTLSYVGPDPVEVTSCSGTGSEGLTIVSVADGVITLDLTIQPTSLTASPAVCLWYRSEGMATSSAGGEAITMTLAAGELSTSDGAAVVRAGGDTMSAVVYDGTSRPVTPPRAATLEVTKGGWNWRANPGGPVLPARTVTTGWSQSPSYVTSGGTILSGASYTPSYDYASQTTVGTEGLVGYQFWDPARATIVDDESSIFVGQYRTAISADTYRLEFTTTQVTTDPATSNTWYPSIAEAGGAAVVSGVRVTYTGGTWAAGVASGTASSMSFNVPFLADASGLITTFSVVDVWTASGDSPLIKAISVAIQPFSTSASITASINQVVTGSPVTYTVRVGASGSTTQPPTTPDYQVAVSTKVTLPSNIVSVDLSGATANGWTLVSETPADLGTDGLPGTADDVSGMILVFTRDTVVDADVGTDLPSFSLTGVTGLNAPASGKMEAALSGILDVAATGERIVANASATISVLQAESLLVEGSTPTARVAVTDDTVQWSTRWSNYSTSSQDGVTYVLDVLPYDGDARGTSTSGSLTLRSATLLGGAAADGVIEVTSTDPSAIGAAPGTAATWTTLAEGTDLSAVTAVRVRLSGIEVGGSGALDVTLGIAGHALDDVLVNSAVATFEGSVLTKSTDPVPVTVAGAAITGRVLIDPDRDGLAGSDGEPADGVSVRLTSATGDRTLTAVTDALGRYSFAAIGAGTYRVEVDTSTIAGTSVTPTLDPDATIDGATEVTVSGLQEVEDLDFAFAVRNPALAVQTVASVPSDDLAAGSTVTFTSTVTNTGDAPLSDLTLTDSLPGDRTTGTWAWPGVEGELAVGESATWTAVHTLDQGEVDAGTVTTTVRVTASDDVASPVSGSAQAQVTVVGGAALSVTGTGTAPGTIATGQDVSWTVTIENTGASTVTGIALTEPAAGTSDWTIDWPGEAGRLAPGESVVATATSALSQAQVDAGTVTAIPTAAGRTVLGTDATATAQVPVTFAVPGAVTVRITVDGSRETERPGTEVTDGDDVAWAYTVTNTGAATLHDVVVTDDRDPSTAITAPDGFSGDLAPGESVQLVATSAALLGERSVTAVVQATAGSGSTQAVGTDTVWCTAVPPELGVIGGHVLLDTARDGLASAPGTPAVGVPVQLADASTGAVVATVATDAGGTYTFSGLAGGTYRVTMDAGVIAGASVTVTVDPDDTLDGTTEVTVGGRGAVAGLDFAVAVRNPALTLTASPEASSTALAAGDQVVVVWTITNSGDTPESAVVLSDELDPARTERTVAWPAADGLLEPGASATVTVRWTLDQADVDAGTLTFRAHAAAVDDLGTAVTTGTVTAQVAVPSGAALTVIGTGVLPETVVAGGEIAWTFTVTSTGAATVTGVQLSEALGGISALAVTWPGDEGVLAPGEQAVATATSTLTQDQVDQGSVAARTTATGTAVTDGAEVTATTPTTLMFPVPGAVTLELTLDGARSAEAPGTQVTVGDSLAWAYLLTNTGATTLHEVTVTDDQDQELALVQPDEFTGDLAPGESVLLTATTTAVRGQQLVTAAVTASVGAGSSRSGASDLAWYTGATVADDGGTDGGTGADAGAQTDAGSSTSVAQVLAITGASVLGAAVLALMLTLAGTALVRLRSRREAGRG
ncbi:MAG TPA: SdrD B-like domain-containing protein [Cellulomonas sp.]